MSFAESISGFFGDLATPATVVNGTSTATESVYFDNPSVLALAGAVVMDAPSVVAAAPTAMVRGSTVTVSGDSFRVRQVEKLDDGALVRVTLEST